MLKIENIVNETEETNKWKDIPCYRLEKLTNLIAHTTHSDLKIQCNTYQNSSGIFSELELS